MCKAETRSVKFSANADLAMETRKDGGKVMRGYPAVFNSRSEMLGWYREEIMPYAFRHALKQNQDVRALYEHGGQAFVLGRTTNHTLRLSEDEHGLFCEIDFPDTQAARDLATCIERKDITQMSFAFTLFSGMARLRVEDGEYVRYLQPDSVKRLYDVGPVIFPAYTDTTISSRSQFLSDGGMVWDEMLRVIERADKKQDLKEEDNKILDSVIELAYALRYKKNFEVPKPEEEKRAETPTGISLAELEQSIVELRSQKK